MLHSTYMYSMHSARLIEILLVDVKGVLANFSATIWREGLKVA